MATTIAVTATIITDQTMGAVLVPDTDQIGTADQECGLEEMDPRPVQPPGSVERLDDEKTCL